MNHGITEPRIYGNTGSFYGTAAYTAYTDFIRME